MMLDEEALANEKARVQPGAAVAGPPPQYRLDEEAAENEPASEAAEPPDQEAAEDGRARPAARPATPIERKMFSKLAQQAMSFLTSPESAEHLILRSQKDPPEQVLADAVQQVMSSATEAAAAGGVQIPQPVQGAATKAAVAALAAIMVKAGLAQDARKLAQGALALVQQGAQPQQPPMEAANGPA